MFTGTFTGVFYEDDLSAAREFYCEQLGLPLLEEQADSLLLQAGDAQLLLRRRTADCAMGPSMIGLEASSVNKLYDRFSSRPDYREAGVLRDTDFDARRLFQMYDPAAMWWRYTPTCARAGRNFDALKAERESYVAQRISNRLLFLGV